MITKNYANVITRLAHILTNFIPQVNTRVGKGTVTFKLKLNFPFPLGIKAAEKQSSE